MSAARKWVAASFIVSALLLSIVTDGLCTPLRRVSPEELQRIIDRGRGKVVVVNFWASYCPPCRVEIPELVELRRDYSAEQLLLIGVSMDVSASHAQSFLNTRPVNYPMYMGSAEVAQAFGVSSIPTIFVYDRQGKAALRHDGYMPSKRLRSAIDRLLQKSK